MAQLLLGLVIAAIGLASDLAFRDFFADRFAREQPIFERARVRGEIGDSADTMLIMDLLAGAVWMRVVFRRLPLDDGFTDQAVNAVLDGVGRPGSPTAGRPARAGG